MKYKMHGGINDHKEVWPSMENKKLILSWGDYFKLCDNLVQQTKDGKFTDIIGISRGGLMPAQYIAYKLGIRRVHSFGMYSYTEDERRMGDSDTCIYQSPSMKFDPGDRVLIVDDVADTGKTIRACLEYVHSVFRINPPMYVCTLHFKEGKSTVTPEYFAEKVDPTCWIQYPYES